MTMEKNDICSSTMVYPDIAKSSVEGGRANVKKIVIISSAVVTSLALILGTILLGIYLTGQKNSYNETQKMISWKDKTGVIISEKMTVNTKTNEEAFETQKISVVYDFDKVPVPDLPVTELNFNVTTVAITNRNFLSTKSKKMCEEFTIFWMIQVNDDGKQNAERKRRSVVPMFTAQLVLHLKPPRFFHCRGMGLK